MSRREIDLDTGEEVTKPDAPPSPQPVSPTAAEILAAKQAEFDAKIASDDPILTFMFDELAALKGTDRAAEVARARPKTT